MNKIFRIFPVVAAALAVAAPLSAKKVSYDLTGRDSSGLNAMDYRLQKPLANDTFPAFNSGFGHNMFIGFGGGISTVADSYSSLGRPGYYATARLGGWFTPIHGIRIAGDVGMLSSHTGVNRTWFGGISAEYLVNLSTLWNGYHPERRVEFIGSVGLEYRRLRQRGNGAWKNNYGAMAALQFRYNLGPTLYLYAEPRFSALTGYKYDRPYDWRRFRGELSLSVGLGYRILQGQFRTVGAEKYTGHNDDDLYFGLSAGVVGVPRANHDYKNPFGEAYVGKYFSSESALQLNIGFGRYHRTNSQPKRNLGIASLDYVLNLSTAAGGYRPDNVFDLLLNAGVAGGMITGGGKGMGRTLSPGLSAGLTAKFNLTHNWSLVLHPQLYMFNRDFTRHLGVARSPLTSFTLGLRYSIGDFSRRHAQSFGVYNDAKDWFITAGAGFDHRFRGNYGEGFNGSVGFGKRFTPVSSWRINVEADMFPKRPLDLAGTVHVDYLSSITTAMMGYDPDRLMDVQLTLGIFGGVANYDSGIKATYGLSSGLNIGFRLNSALDLYVEPQFIAANTPRHGSSRMWTPQLRVNAGLRYKLGTPSGRVGTFANAPFGQRRNFVSLAGGPNIFSAGITGSGRSAMGMLDVSLGRWFSTVSAFRLTYASDWLRRASRTNYLGALHADYMLNFTSLLERDANRRFHIIGAVGVGFGFSDADNTKTGLMTYGGVQFRYNLPCNLDLHLEPGLNFYANRIIPRPGTSANRVAVMGRLAAGLSLRF